LENEILARQKYQFEKSAQGFSKQLGSTLFAKQQYLTLSRERLSLVTPARIKH